MLMKIHLLGGFLGSGKTTAIQSAIRVLGDQGVKCGVITNDQGIRLVDADLFKQMGVPGRQVTNGCFCCNYQDLESQIQSLIETEQPEIIFAESVGSCTDIVATVLKPLRRFRPDVRTTLSVFADGLLLHMLLVNGAELFEDPVRYLYFKQLEEARMLIINKVDLLNPGQLGDLKKVLEEKYGNSLVQFQNSQDKYSIGRWLQQLDKIPSLLIPESLEIDYDIYGAGEAKLAWLDQEMEIESESGGANLGAVDLIRGIFHKVTACKYAIGHLKFLLNGKNKISFTLSSPRTFSIKIHPAVSATLLLNARVQTEPETLLQLISESVREEEERSKISIRIRSISAFRPGYPIPAHRIG
jgi:CobW/HypB/UreG, nucleotide-binding domain